MPSVVVVEGDTDKAIVEALLPSVPVGRPTRGEEAGREAAMRVAAAAAKQIGTHRIVLLLDRNGGTPEQIDAEVSGVLKREWGETPDRKGAWFVRNHSAVRIVLSGLPADAELKALGIERYASDDYVLRLCLEDAALSAFCAGESRLSFVPRDSATLKELLTDVTRRLGDRGVKIDTAKRYCDLIRAILGFRATPATFAGHIVSRCPDASRETTLGELRRMIEADPPLA